jgi:hypothetical protein
LALVYLYAQQKGNARRDVPEHFIAAKLCNLMLQERACSLAKYRFADRVPGAQLDNPEPGSDFIFFRRSFPTLLTLRSNTARLSSSTTQTAAFILVKIFLLVKGFQFRPAL